MTLKKFLFLFFLILSLFYNGVRFLSETKSNNIPFGQSFFLQTEQGRLHLIHKDKNTYSIHHT